MNVKDNDRLPNFTLYMKSKRYSKRETIQTTAINS